MEWLWDLLVNLHWGAVGQIIMIDILLGGDNAVVIALACRNLPHEQRLKGVFWGMFDYNLFSINSFISLYILETLGSFSATYVFVL